MALVDLTKPSTIAAIIYFGLYFILVISIGIYVRIRVHGKHEGFATVTCTVQFIKDLWSEREIYAAILAHFYDTATDVGVLINWYALMQDELNGTNYKSVDMRIYFYAGLGFMFLYRICVLISTCYKGKWYDWLLAVFDLYIIKAVFKSIKEAEATIDKRRKRSRVEKQIEMSSADVENDAGATSEKTDNVPDANGDSTEKTTKKRNIILNKFDTATEHEIELSDLQQMVQMGESVTESMPQVVLQTAFIIRAVNDPELNKESDTVLILFSIIASVISIGNKYRWLDTKSAKKEYKTINISMSFPDCINYWYLWVGLWRYCDIIVRFTVFSLIWAVMGGAFIPIYFCLSYCVWLIATRFMLSHDDEDVKHDHDLLEYLAIAVVNIVGVWSSPKWRYHLLKWIENGIALAVIGYFAYFDFKCSICALPRERDINNNIRIQIFYYMGCIAWLIEIITIIPIQFRKVFANFDVKMQTKSLPNLSMVNVNSE